MDTVVHSNRALLFINHRPYDCLHGSMCIVHCAIYGYLVMHTNYETIQDMQLKGGGGQNISFLVLQVLPIKE